MGGLKTWFLAQTNLVKFLLVLVFVLACRLLSLTPEVSEADSKLTATAQMETGMAAVMSSILETLTAQPTQTATDTAIPTNTEAPTNTPTNTYTPTPTFTPVPTLAPTRAPTATSVPFNQGNLGGGGGGAGGGGGGSGGGGGGSGCDPAYPTVCIPPPPPDLDCGDISYRRFTVLSPDPHNFDGNHDGVGCER